MALRPSIIVHQECASTVYLYTDVAYFCPNETARSGVRLTRVLPLKSGQGDD